MTHNLKSLSTSASSSIVVATSRCTPVDTISYEKNLVEIAVQMCEVLMEIQQLIYFLEITETQSFTKAANKLFVSQPALSKSLHRLEEELDSPLLIRDGKNIVLTEAGELLYQRAKKILSSIDSIPIEISDLQGKGHHSVKIKARALLGILPEIIAEFQCQHPEIHFTLRTGGELTIPETEYDLLIKPAYEDYEKRNSLLLLNELIYLAVPQGSALADSGFFRITDLQNVPLIMPSKNCFFYEIIRSWLEENNVTPMIQADSDDPNAIIDLIRNGCGVSLIPEYSVSSRNISGVQFLLPESGMLSRSVILQWNNFGYMSTDAKIFKRYLTRFFNDIRQENKTLESDE